MSQKIVGKLRREVRAIPYTELVTRYSSNAVARAVAAGELVRILPGYYAADIHSESFAVRLDATVRWLPSGSAITGIASMYLRGALPVAPEFIDVVVPYPLRRRFPRWLRMTSKVDPVRTLVLSDIAVEHAPDAVVRAYEAEPVRVRDEIVYGALRGKLVSPGTLKSAVVTRARVRGRRHLLTLISRFEAGSESFLEHKTSVSVLTGPEFQRLIRQHWVAIDGRRFRLDFFDPETMTAFEADGSQVHGSEAAQLRDTERDALLAAVGIQTVRFSYRNVMERPQWCRNVARRVLRQRGTQAGSAAA